MDVNKISIKLNVENLDETIEKMNRLVEALRDIERILLRIESKVELKSLEEYYEKHGIPRTFAYQSY